MLYEPFLYSIPLIFLQHLRIKSSWICKEIPTVLNIPQRRLSALRGDLPRQRQTVAIH